MGARTFLTNLFRKPQPLPHVVVQPRCTCGRFCSTHDTPDMTAKLISELSAKGIHIPARLRPASPDGRG